MAPKTWLVTGCTSGFGADFVLEALRRGDKAIATGRGDVSRLSTLKDAGAHVYSLDVAAPSETINSTVAKMIQEVGDIDILVNNAGILQIGFIGELELDKWRQSLEINFFGSLKMTQALLPHFRSRRSGDVVFIGSILGLSGLWSCPAYAVSKFALEGLHDCLKTEGAHSGIRSLMFEVGLCRTSMTAKTNYDHPTAPVAELKPVRDFLGKLLPSMAGNEAGDPKKVAKIIVDMVKGEGVAEGREVPDRLVLGTDSFEAVKPKAEQIRKQWDEWEDVIMSTNCDDVVGNEQADWTVQVRNLKPEALA